MIDWDHAAKHYLPVLITTTEDFDGTPTTDCEIRMEWNTTRKKHSRVEAEHWTRRLTCPGCVESVCDRNRAKRIEVHTDFCSYALRKADSCSDVR